MSVTASAHVPAEGKYAGKDNYGKPRSEYLERISKMSDNDLVKETADKIWLSAYASNNPRSDYHWHCDACYDEAKRRGKLSLYDKAYKQLTAK